MYQKLIILALFIIGEHSQIIAQDYTLSAKTQRINDTKCDGFIIKVKGDSKKVTRQTYSYLKAKAKLRKKRNYYSLAGLKTNQIHLDTTLVYLKIAEKVLQTTVWLGIKTANLEENKVEKIKKALQAELVKIARSYYVHEQEVKISEAEKVAKGVSNKYQFLINQNKKLNKNLKKAENRKIDLENMLETKKFEIEDLKQKLIDNDIFQDSVYVDLQNVKEIVEKQKQKLEEIN